MHIRMERLPPALNETGTVDLWPMPYVPPPPQDYTIVSSAGQTIRDTSFFCRASYGGMRCTLVAGHSSEHESRNMERHIMWHDSRCRAITAPITDLVFNT